VPQRAMYDCGCLFFAPAALPAHAGASHPKCIFCV
jgi:hypothetical protein